MKTEFSYQQLSRKRIFIIWMAVILCIAAFAGNVLVGSSGTAPVIILKGIFFPDQVDMRIRAIIWSMRLPMGIMGVLVGGALGASGAVMQTILNNPLASPYTLGISAGAGFGASLALLGGFGIATVLGTLLVPACAFLFALLAGAGIYLISIRKNFTSATMVLAGIGMVFFFQALQSFMQYIASPEALQSIVFWMFGSLQKANWIGVFALLIVFILAFIRILMCAWKLTAMKLGDSRACSMGVNIERLRREMFFLISLLTATAVAFVGSIGFIGIVGPHVARMIVGEDQRYFMPMSALNGAILLSVSSIISKILVPGTIFPIGILTSLIGVPFFFFLILKQRGNQAC